MTRERVDAFRHDTDRRFAADGDDGVRRLSAGEACLGVDDSRPVSGGCGAGVGGEGDFVVYGVQAGDFCGGGVIVYARSKGVGGTVVQSLKYGSSRFVAEPKFPLEPSEMTPNLALA